MILLYTFFESKIFVAYYSTIWLILIALILIYWTIRPFLRDKEIIDKNSINLLSEDYIRETTLVMIPAYNEEQTIQLAVQNALKHVSRVLVINDGSTDNTAILAEQAGAIVLNNEQNMGLAETFKSGALYAANLPNVKAIVNFDADLQYDIDDLPYLVSPILAGERDLMIGSRLAGAIEYMPKIKYLGNHVFTKVLAILTGVRISDGQSGYRAFTADLINSIYLRPGFTYTQQMIIEAVYRHFRIGEIPIDFSTRKSGDSRLMSNAFDFAVKANKLLFRIVFIEYFPLHAFGLLATMLTVSVIAFTSIVFNFIDNQLIYAILVPLFGVSSIISGYWGIVKLNPSMLIK
jgi:glycosyltransferase involved in cell wall biosynthesis